MPEGIGGPQTVPLALLALFLMGAIVVAYRFPLRVLRKTKVYMSSVPFYLLAVLVSPPLAATAAGLGALLGELSVRAQRGTLAGDLASEAGRRVLVVFLGALLAHVPVEGAWHPVLLVGTALVLGSGDVLTCPLVLAPMTGEPPLRLIGAVARQATLLEGAQYLLGLLGVLAAQQVWGLAVLALSTALVYLSLRASA
jgi:hypothetical protein